MDAARSRLYRALGTFWLGRRSSWLRSLAQSRAYEPALAAVFAAGICVVAAGAVYLPFAGHYVAAIVWVGAGTLTLAALLLVSTSRGRTAMAAAQHDAVPEALLARCRELLESHSFHVYSAAPGRLRAVRDTSTQPKDEWRGTALEVLIAVSGSEAGVALRACCTVGGGAVLDQTRVLVQQSCDAIAALDGLTLCSIDQSLVLRQRAWFLGGLAGSMFYALAASALLGILATAALGSFVAALALELQASELLTQRARAIVFQVQQVVRLPLRMELDRLLSGLAAGKAPPASPAAALRRMLASGPREALAVAIKRPGEGIELIWPAHGHPLRRELAKALSEKPVWGLQRIGDKLVARLARTDTAKFEARLGLQAGQLIVATVLSYDELARRLPRVAATGGVTEVSFFQAGQSLLRCVWDEKGRAQVDVGSASIPRDVLVSRIQGQDGDEDAASLRHLLAGVSDSFDGTSRTELRGRVPYRVFYALREDAGSGWRGFAFAAPSASFQTWIANLAYAALVVAALGLLVILFATHLAAFVVARRISRPVADVRDALSAIAEGDFSVRVATTRSDEIGQLQRLLNVVAEALRRRETMKDLFGKYLSKQVAEQILSGDGHAALTGSRRQVSVLFADVRGFTAYAEQHDPEQVTLSLNEYFEVMVDVVVAHEGVLDKYIGDGLMVVFGAPMAQQDHAMRAVFTALEMQAALHSLNLRRLQRGDDPIAIGIGVNTGVAISGNLGSLKRMEFTVIGDTVNLAARLEGRAGHGQILIGRATFEQVKDWIEHEPLGPISVKGKTEPVEIWLVKGAKTRAGAG